MIEGKIAGHPKKYYSPKRPYLQVNFVAFAADFWHSSPSKGLSRNLVFIKNQVSSSKPGATHWLRPFRFPSGVLRKVG
jgi:hypothetical protein